jgi:hypothetical protein
MNNIIDKDLILNSLIECKKRMDEYRFLSTYFAMHYNYWSSIRVFLLKKNFIKKRHHTYVWIGEKPNEELTLEFIKYYIASKKDKKTDKTTPKEPSSKDSTTMYEDLVALQKQVQKLKEENREIYKELKENYSEKVKVQKAYQELYLKIKTVIYNTEKENVLYNFYKKSIEEHLKENR